MPPITRSRPRLCASSSTFWGAKGGNLVLINAAILGAAIYGLDRALEAAPAEIGPGVLHLADLAARS